jgi:hypothetical protein
MGDTGLPLEDPGDSSSIADRDAAIARDLNRLIEGA